MADADEGGAMAARTRLLATDAARRLSDERWMGQALALAREAGARGEVPVGAIVVKRGRDRRSWRQRADRTRTIRPRTPKSMRCATRRGASAITGCPVASSS